MINQVLARDGYRCVVTGMYNRSSLEHCQELARESGEAMALMLEMGHIFNESTMQNINPEIDRDHEQVRTYQKVPFYQ